ncbi:MAG TPA: glycosyltransferase [Planctomycetota bacterium]|nr:glycosyltransferase [Planctomycetota bacterium]
MTHKLALVTIPTLNERENLHGFMKGIVDLQDENLHVLLADDDSLDGTWRTYGTQYAADSKRFHLMRRPGRDKGRGFALREAWKWALEHQPPYAYIIEMAGNRTDDPAHLPALLAKLEAGADVVVCERSAQPGGDASAPRKSWGFARTLVGAPVQDFESGYRGFSRRALELIDPKKLRSADHGLKAEVMMRVGKLQRKHGLKVVTVAVPFTPPDATHRQGGNTGLGGQMGLFVRRITGG